MSCGVGPVIDVSSVKHSMGDIPAPVQKRNDH
jgi:hypothetical protein